jgi:gliding motility-associated-like protein
MRFFCFILLLCSFSVNAQVCSGPGFTAQSGIAVCGSLVFNQQTLASCTGPDLPPSGCSDPVTSSNSNWYKIHCYASGTFGFLIQPGNGGDDYDWQVMDVTNRPPTDVYTTNLRMSVNLSATTGSTGCTSAGTTDINCAGATPRFNRLLNLVTGGDYLLMVTNYSNSGTGYNLSFTGGTALLTNVAPPTVTSVAQVGCNPSQIKVNFSEDILCTSLTISGSEFIINNGPHIITSITSACSGGTNAFNTLTLNLQTPLVPGTYTLTINNGTDGNTLLDVCNDPMPAGVPVSFTIAPQTPATITQVTKANCAVTILKVALNKPVQCNSISATGSEFTILPGLPAISSVTTNCSGTNLSTDTIFINLQNPLADGNYTLVANVGSDGNTFIDNCSIAMGVGTNRTFTLATTPAPTVSNPPPYCQSETAVVLQTTGINLLWYTNATGGTGSVTAPVPSTTTAGTFNFYVSQTMGGCEGPRALITVTVNPSPAAPTVSPAIFNYCTGQAATALSATGSNILWHTTPTGGTSSSTAPTPSTAVAGTTSYYATQTITGCESPTRAVIIVNVTAAPAAPSVTTPVEFCQNAPSTQLTAAGTNLLWYNTAIGGTGSSTAPTPSTTTLGSTNYFVSQTNIGSSSCEGPRAQIIVNIVTTPSSPTVTSPLNYCQNQTVTALTAGGSNLLWYANATGGTGSTTAPTPSTATVGSITYYVSQSAGTCESPRSAITVNVATTPPAPTVTPQVNYCVGNTAVPLTAPGTNLKWYNVATGGTAFTTAPTPSTTTAGTTSYFVSQSIGTCESPRAEIMVVVTAIPAAPMVGPTVNYCQGETPMNFIVSGTNLLWYANATGGVGNPLAPTVSTVAVSTNTYYVSQSAAGCEGPRSSITVNVNATLPAPTVPPTQIYCQNAPTNPLVVTGSNLRWYTQATGGASSTTTPVVSSAVAGTTTYYVSQTSGNCESPRVAITINITASPAAPTVASIINFCPNQIVGPLSDSVTGINLLWYANATGGTGSSTSPTVPTNVFPATYTYYVSQSSSAATGSCEGPRAQITVNVDNFLNINIGNDTTICEGISVKFFPTVTPAGAQYQWRSLNEPNSTIDVITMLNATVKPLNTSEYVLQGIFGGCIKEDTVKVSVRTKPLVDAGQTAAICLNDSTLLSATISRITAPGIVTKYLWTPSFGIRNDTLLQTFAYPTKTTLYTLTATTTVADYGCDFVSTGTVNVVVQPIVFANAGRDTIAVKGSPHQLQGSGAAFYEWSSPTAIINNPIIKNPFTVLNDDAVFYLKATDAIGCVGSDTVFVKVLNGPAYYVPNAFTPNGDGQNDIFRAIPAGLANTTYFRVFNRYGVVMFETNQYLKGWDGTFNGKPQPAGVYVWMIAGTDKDFKKIALKGTVNLIR